MAGGRYEYPDDDFGQMVEKRSDQVVTRLGLWGHPDEHDCRQRCFELAIKHRKRLSHHSKPSDLLRAIFRQVDRDDSWRDFGRMVEKCSDQVIRRLGLWGHPDEHDCRQRCLELALKKRDTLQRHKNPWALTKTIFRQLDRDASWRSSGVALTEWQARQLFSARREAQDADPGATFDEVAGEARRIYVENGGKAAEFDNINQGQLSLFQHVAGGDEGGTVELVELLADAKVPLTDSGWTQDSFDDQLLNEVDPDAPLIFDLYRAEKSIRQTMALLGLTSYKRTRRLLNEAIAISKQWAVDTIEAAPEAVGDDAA